jgi:glycopeptide antibiotics resistance protein
LTWESTMAPSAKRSMKPKFTFISFSFYVILLFELFFLVLSIGRSRVYVLFSCYVIGQGNKS